MNKNTNKKYNFFALALTLISITVNAGFNAEFDLSTLDGTNGYLINGVNEGDGSGRSVSNAGDINGDGIDDMIIGAHSVMLNGNFSGASYIVFGKSVGNNPVFELSSIDGTNGIVFYGENEQDSLGRSVSGAGDLNNDGIDDLIIGVPRLNNVGAAYIVFGSTSPFPNPFDLTSLNGSNGFVFTATSNGGNIGQKVSRAGDFNNDGIDDILIGAYVKTSAQASTSGVAYIIFGNNTFLPVMNVSELDGNNGVTIEGIETFSFFGDSLGSLGDINGDSVDDIIIGAYRSNNYTGASYVVFGDATGFPSVFNVANLNGSNGFSINGINSGDYFGHDVSSAGDINSDGLNDIIIGSPRAQENGLETGAAYVIFGSNVFSSSLDLTNLNGSNGFVINGDQENSGLGFAVSNAGDINTDGLDDLIISALFTGNFFHGACYVVFGKNTAFSTPFNINSLDGNNGFVVKGLTGGDKIGESLSIAGDVNGDGLNDILIGASQATSDGTVNGPELGTTYAIFGKVNLNNLIIVKSGNGTGVVTSNIGNINCGLICIDDYISESIVTLSAVADNNMTFIGWSGSGCSGTNDCVVSMSQPKVVTATFMAPEVIFQNSFE